MPYVNTSLCQYVFPFSNGERPSCPSTYILLTSLSMYWTRTTVFCKLNKLQTFCHLNFGNGWPGRGVYISVLN